VRDDGGCDDGERDDGVRIDAREDRIGGGSWMGGERAASRRASSAQGGGDVRSVGGPGCPTRESECDDGTAGVALASISAPGVASMTDSAASLAAGLCPSAAGLPPLSASERISASI
jgi:hypothetical protein